MDQRSARRALRAWRAVPKPVRRNVVERARQGLPAEDPEVGRLAVGWARSEYPVAFAWLLGVAALMLAGRVALPVLRALDLRLLSLWAYATWLVLIVALGVHVFRLYRSAGTAAAVNLSHLVVTGAYRPASTLDVRATTRVPGWFVAGLVGLTVAAAVVAWFTDPDRPAEAVLMPMWPLAIILAVAVTQNRWPHPKGMPRRPRGGAPLLRLDGAGLTTAYDGRTVPWSAVAAADVAPMLPGVPLALAFAAGGPAFAVCPVHWLDADPGVVLATARALMAEARGGVTC